MHRIARAVRAIKQQQQQVPERQPFLPYVTLRTPNSLSIEWVFEEGVSTNTEKRYLSVLQVCEPDTLTWQTVYRGFSCKFCVCCLRAGTLYKLRLRVDRDGVQGPWGEAVTAHTRDETNSIQNLHRAIQYGYYQEVIKIVKSRPTASESTYTDMGLTPLQLAVEQGDQRLVEALLQHFSPAALDAVSIGGAARTALMMAAGNGSTELVHLLTERGANWDMVDRNGLTALHYAVDGSQLQIVQFALENTQGVFVDAKDNCDWTPLLRGVILGSSLQVLECLINHGAQVNHRDKNGLSCLSAAVIGQRRSVLRLLLNSGADVHLPGDSQQNSPLMIAEELGIEEIVDILSPAVIHVPYTPAVRVNVDSEEEIIE